MLWKTNELAAYLHNGFITFSKKHKFRQHSSSILWFDKVTTDENAEKVQSYLLEGFLSNRQDHEPNEESVM